MPAAGFRVGILVFNGEVLVRWFKHMTDADDNEKLSRLQDEFGLEGYGFWWRVVEIIAKRVNEENQTDLCYSAKSWARRIGVSTRKFKKLLSFCAGIGLVSASHEKDMITVNMPNILKYRDEYTAKKGRTKSVSDDVSGQCPDSRARALTDTETDTDTETEKEKEREGEKERQCAHSLSESKQSKPAKTQTRKEKQPEPGKNRFGEYGNVLLLQGEYARLCEKFTPELTDKAIAFLDLHIGAKGKDEYKSHNLALQKWVFDAVREREAKKLQASPQKAQSPLTQNMITTAAVLAARQQRRRCDTGYTSYASI